MPPTAPPPHTSAAMETAIEQLEEPNGPNPDVLGDMAFSAEVFPLSY